MLKRSKQMFITETTSRADLLKVWNENTSEMLGAFLAANVDPDLDSTPTEDIRRVILQWIEDGDECAAA
jgi:hypothetical protein